MPIKQGRNRGNHKHAVLERRRRISALYCEGLSQHEIARVVGVSQMAVSKHLKVVREEWLAGTQRDYSERVAEELARLSHLESTAWASFQRSKLASEPGLAERPGDVRFLDQVFKCRLAKLKVEGLLKPSQVNVNTTFNQIDWSELFRRTEEHEVDQVERKLAQLEAGLGPPRLTVNGTNGTSTQGGI